MPVPDPFVGRWELDPSTLLYEHGRPGRRAVYTIEAVPEGLTFTLDADDADGKPMAVKYGGKLDGEDRALPGPNLTLTLSRVDERQIESVLKKNRIVIDRWTRTLAPDGRTMTITQHGMRPNGGAFRNTGIYRRVD
jgi:hypothetical protein